MHGYEVFVYLQGYRSPSELFKPSRPDLVIVKNNELTVIELTCCFETNIIKSRDYKIKKYSNIEKEVTNRHYTIKSKIFVEITTLGFISSNIKYFTSLFKGTDINTNRMLKKVKETAIRCSYYLYTKRTNKQWLRNKDILKFY